MAKLGLNASVATLLAAVSIATAAPSAPTPSGARSAQDVVDFLQEHGYDVILDKIGTLPLDQCGVAAVRPGRAISSTDATGGDREEILNGPSAYVLARC